MGAVTPIGNDSETFWSNLLAGVSGAGPITTFDTTGYDVRIAAEVKDFDPTLTMDRKMVRRMSRFIHFGVAAATEAVERLRARLRDLDARAAGPRRGRGQHRRRRHGAGHRGREDALGEGPRPGQPVRHPRASRAAWLPPSSR